MKTFTVFSSDVFNVMSSPWPPPAHKLIKSAFLEYARLLRSLGLREGAALWASRAGSAGEQLMEELFQGEGSVPENVISEDKELGQESTEWPLKDLEKNGWWCKSRIGHSFLLLNLDQCEWTLCQRPEESWSSSGEERRCFHVESVSLFLWLQRVPKCLVWRVCLCTFVNACNGPKRNTLLSWFPPTREVMHLVFF